MQVIDCNNMIFGRVASHVAKAALSGEDVHLINAEKMVMCGNPDAIAARYLQKRRLQNKGTPEYSPKWSKVPHLLVKRLIRGMLPWRTARGKAAYRKYMVYAGNPKKLESNKKIEKAEFDGINKHITILDLCRRLGYSG